MKTSKGRQKIEIKLIEDKKARQVTFTKRRQGLFKKCAQVCSDPDTQLAAVTFSVAGRPYSYGNPCPDSVINRYLTNYASNPRYDDHYSRDDDNCCNNNWWERSVDKLGLQELEEFKVALEGLKKKVLSRVDDVSRSWVTAQSLNNLDCVDLSRGTPLPVEATECLNLGNDNDALLSGDENEDFGCTYEEVFGYE